MRALLFSFFGSKYKHMNKYKNIYQNMGINADIFKINIKDSISFNGWKKMQLINANKFNNYDIVHVMSGGVFSYYNLDKVNDINPEYFIYDSGPFYPSSDNVGQYISSMFPTYLYPHSRNITDKMCNTLWKLEGYDQYKNLPDYEKFLLKHNNILLLNSINDKVLIRDKVDNFINEYQRKNNEGKIKEILWTNSNHVNHLLMNEKEYVLEIKNFINSK